MSLLKKLSLTRLFRHASHTAARPHTRRFRPKMLVLEDRTVPAADFFADATLLSGSVITTTGSNVGATAEAGEPVAGSNGVVNSVWWKWTAQENGAVEVNTFGSALDTVLGVYTGDAVNNLTVVATNDDALNAQSQVVFEALAGTTYRIRVDGYGSATGNIVLKLGTTPANDDFAGATVASGTVLGSNLAATGESGEPTAGTSGDVNTVWWSWTASTSETVEISTVSSDFDTLLAVYTGSAVGALTLVVANDDFDYPNAVTSKVTFNAVAGTTYRIAVDGFLNETGNVVLNLPASPPPPPSNTAPTITNQSLSVNENSAAGIVVGTVAASDADAGQTLTYAIVAGNDSGAFAINAATGQITVANAALNFEGTNSFSLTVQVTDSGTPALANSATVTVNVNDVNEAPVLGGQTFSLNENSAAGTVVGAVTGSDVDAGQTLTYAIVAGNTSGAFAIDVATGQITVANAAALNYEANPTFALTVQVTDSGSPALSSSATVTVNLNDVNEAPVLDNTGSMSLNAINYGQTNNAGTLISDLLASAGGNRISDPDAGAKRGIAIVAADTRYGSWQFSTNGGATWTALGTVSNGSARLLAADANTRVRFIPAFGYSGTVTNGLTFRAWDQTVGVNGGLADTSINGGSSAFSVETETASIRVRSLLASLLG
jgi:VCBS repeat-containing protein